MPESLPIRIVLLAPPAGVPWALQVGKAAASTLVGPAVVTQDRVVLATTLSLAGVDSAGQPVLRGPAVQGPAGGRFIYANSGLRAGDTASGFDRRAKIPLATITPALLAEWRRTPGAWLEARVAGTGRDGGPACATVALLDGGWRLVAPGPSDAARRSAEADG